MLLGLLRRAAPAQASRCFSTKARARRKLPTQSIWLKNKEMSKESLLAAKEITRVTSDPLRLQHFLKHTVSRLIKSDLISLLLEVQRQDNVLLTMKLYDVVRKEIWYLPDMYFYRDMLKVLARNKKVEETRKVWEDLKKEKVLFDQKTFAIIIRAYVNNGLLTEAMNIYAEMKWLHNTPRRIVFRVILESLIPYPELRKKVKDDYLKVFPIGSVHGAIEDMLDDWTSEDSDDNE